MEAQKDTEIIENVNLNWLYGFIDNEDTFYIVTSDYENRVIILELKNNCLYAEEFYNESDKVKDWEERNNKRIIKAFDHYKDFELKVEILK